MLNKLMTMYIYTYIILNSCRALLYFDFSPVFKMNSKYLFSCDCVVPICLYFVDGKVLFLFNLKKSDLNVYIIPKMFLFSLS